MASNQRDLSYGDPVKAALSSPSILSAIFKHLAVNDIFQCRKASKVFRDYCDQRVMFEELVAVRYLNETKNRWYRSNKLIKYSQDAVDLSTFFEILTDVKLIIGLKRLHIGNFGSVSMVKILVKPIYMNLKTLNRFVNLELLQIEFRVSGNQLIDLPNLVSLRIKGSDNSQFRLKTPKLKHLCFDNLSLLVIDHPETITHVTGLSAFTVKLLKQLKNLEHLSFIWGSEVQLSENVIKDFKHLKHLSFELATMINKATVQKIVHSILSQKTSLKRDETKIYLNGVEIMKTNKFDEFFSIVETFTQPPQIASREEIFELLRKYIENFQGRNNDRLSYMIKNYDLLTETMIDEDELNYDELMRLFNRKLPDGFFDKFPNVSCVRVDAKVDEQHLLSFLKCLPLIVQLFFLKKTSLSQAFFEQLPDACESLRHLKVENSTTTSFDFISRFKTLNDFHTDLEFANSFHLALQAFKELKWLNDIRFSHNEQSFVFQRPKVNRQLFNFECYTGDLLKPSIIFKQEGVSYARLMKICDRFNKPKPLTPDLKRT